MGLAPRSLIPGSGQLEASAETQKRLERDSSPWGSAAVRPGAEEPVVTMSLPELLDWYKIDENDVLNEAVK